MEYIIYSALWWMLFNYQKSNRDAVIVFIGHIAISRINDKSVIQLEVLESLLNGGYSRYGPSIFSGKQIKPFVSSPPPSDPRGRGKLFKGPAALLSRERHNANARRLYTGLYVGERGFASGGTISTLLHMGIGNARRSRRIIRTPSAIPKLCWMHANCHEGTHPCTSRTSTGCPNSNVILMISFRCSPLGIDFLYIHRDIYTYINYILLISYLKWRVI